MATRKAERGQSSARVASPQVSTNPEALMLAAIERGGDLSTTGRFLLTFKEGSLDEGMKVLQSQRGLRIANARDFEDQAAVFEEAGDADALVFPEIGVVLVGGEAATARGMTAGALIADDSPVLSIDPEYFMFANGINPTDYMKGVLHTAQMIYADLAEKGGAEEVDLTPEVLAATWGLIACKVPSSSRDGNGIRVADLDTGFDLGHPEFAGRTFVTSTFVGQPVQDLHGHGTHTAGTACGPKMPPGAIPRYGIGYKTQFFIGKVLSNTGSGSQGGVLAGMNWAIANKCVAINMSLGAQIGVQPSYTAAGAAALANGCLILAAAGNASNRPASIQPTGAPANSPTIMSVGALDSALKVAVFSNGGKVDIAGPGLNVLSSWPRPVLHKTISGTSMATPHVTGCAALWAQTSPSLRGAALRAKLLSSAKHLPLPPSDVGAGIVQAP